MKAKVTVIFLSFVYLLTVAFQLFMEIPWLSLPVLLRRAHVFAAPIYSAIITAR